MAEDGKFRVEKFNGQNFSLWKMQMEDYLYQKDLDPDLNRNATNYRDNHIHKDAAEIILHFINGKY